MSNLNLPTITQEKFIALASTAATKMITANVENGDIECDCNVIVRLITESEFEQFLANNPDYDVNDPESATDFSAFGDNLFCLNPEYVRLYKVESVSGTGYNYGLIHY